MSLSGAAIRRNKVRPPIARRPPVPTAAGLVRPASAPAAVAAAARRKASNLIGSGCRKSCCSRPASKTVGPYFDRFVARWPGVEGLGGVLRSRMSSGCGPGSAIIRARATSTRGLERSRTRRGVSPRRGGNCARCRGSGLIPGRRSPRSPSTGARAARWKVERVLSRLSTAVRRSRCRGAKRRSSSNWRRRCLRLACRAMRSRALAT